MSENLQRSSSPEEVLLIGSVSSEGIKSALSAVGIDYRMKMLASTPENWETIVEIFESAAIRCTIVKFTGWDYYRLSSPHYDSVRDQLLRHIGARQHVVFVHDSLLGEKSASKETEETESDEFNPFRDPTEEERSNAHRLFEHHRLNVLGYQRNAEVTVLATEFIEEVAAGLLFRLYIPNERIWANELDRILTLFRDYLGRVGFKAVRLDHQRTERGTMYRFYTRSGAQPETSSVAREFEKFTELLDLCITDTVKAEQLLRDCAVAPDEVAMTLSRYAKEARRLYIDLKHDRDRKLLAIRQQLESELVEQNVSLELLYQLADRIIPNPVRLSQATQFPMIELSAGNNSHLTVNISSDTVNAVNSVVAQHVEGNVHLENEAKQILQLIEKYGDGTKHELTSQLQLLLDKSASAPQRLGAKQKLSAFLKMIGNKIPDVGVGVLVQYLAKALGVA